MKNISKQLMWFDRAHRFEPHFHTQFFIGAVLRGECHFISGGQPYRARQGDLVLIPPYEVHEARCDASTRYHATYIGDDVLERLFGLDEQIGPGRPDFELNGRVFSNSPFAPRLVQAIEANDLEGLWMQVIAILVHHLCPPESATAAAGRGTDLLAAIRTAAVRGEQIRNVARRMGYTPEAFSRAFQQRFGMRAVFCKNQLRLQMAEDDLMLGKVASIVAMDSGFADQAHFTRELKKYRGVPPGAYAQCYRPLDGNTEPMAIARIFKTWQ